MKNTIFDLTGRTALVTGGSKGIGNAIARGFANAGADLFLCSRTEFAAHAEGRKQLRMEFFYREMRKRHAVLVDDGKPTGGDWNFDSENRKSFGKDGPPLHKAPRAFPSDEITRGVIAMVNARFANHPGELAQFDWPVTSADAAQPIDH